MWAVWVMPPQRGCAHYRGDAGSSPYRMYLLVAHIIMSWCRVRGGAKLAAFLGAELVGMRHVLISRTLQMPTAASGSPTASTPSRCFPCIPVPRKRYALRVRARATLGASQGVTTEPERLTGGAATLLASSGLKTVCVAIAGIAAEPSGTWSEYVHRTA